MSQSVQNLNPQKAPKKPFSCFVCCAANPKVPKKEGASTTKVDAPVGLSIEIKKLKPQGVLHSGSTINEAESNDEALVVGQRNND